MGIGYSRSRDLDRDAADQGSEARGADDHGGAGVDEQDLVSRIHMIDAQTSLVHLIDLPSAASTAALVGSSGRCVRGQKVGSRKTPVNRKSSA